MSSKETIDSFQAVRDHVIANSRGGHAFDTFDEIAREVPAGLRGTTPAGAGHSAWQVLEHIRLSQRDILDFSRNDDGAYQEKAWPDEYWPKQAEPPTARSWDDSVAAILADRKAIEALVADPNQDLFAPFPWGDGQTLLREAMMAADHTAYHLGQLVVIDRLLKAR